MQGKRVLVVGASAGIGRSVSIKAVQAGAQVVMAARRADRLAEVIETAGGGTAATGDVRTAGDAERIVVEAVAAMGGIDLVVYATGTSPLRRLRDVGPPEWLEVLETNTIGAHLIARAAVTAMSPEGLIAVISSDSVGVPRPGLVHYAASKAALEELLRGCRVEFPGVRFSCLAVGPTFPTEFGSQFEPELIGELFGEWDKLGMVFSTIMDTDGVADVLLQTLDVILANPSISLDYFVVRPHAVATTDPPSLGK